MQRIIVNKGFALKFTAVILFVLLFAFGLLLAQLKPLWNDELYSQIYSIEKISYASIVLGHIPEGNNAPLFYILQKAVCDLAHFQLPFEWKGDWNIAQAQAQIILRLMPNFFMAAALAIIFYGIAVEYSWLAGIYAFLTALSSSAVWMYWVEARPYALWFVLTAGQVLYFLRFIRHSEQRPQMWRNLAVVHILLPLTVVFGAVQAFIVSLLLFVFHERKLSRYFSILFLPLGFGFFYFLTAPHYAFELPADPLSLLFANIPSERLLLIVLCGILTVSIARWEKRKAFTAVFLQYGIFIALLFGAALAIMICFALATNPAGRGFAISSRYFIFLAPVGIVGTAVFLFEWCKEFSRYHWLVLNLGILAGGILLLRSLKIIAEISALGIY